MAAVKTSSPRVAHVIVDSAGFLKNIQLQTLGDNLYTVPEVVDEIKDKATRDRLQFLPYELKFKSFPPDAYTAVVEFSKKTGDYPSLSLTDMKVLALTYQLTKEIVGTDQLKTEPAKKEVVVGSQKETVAGFCVPPEDEDEMTSDFGWITPDNVQDHLKTGVVDNSPVLVACLTTDFAMQNVLLQMGMHVIAADGMLIRETKTFILRCFACFKTTSIMTKVFCPHCGNKTLKRVSVKITENGNQIFHISKRPINIKGTKYSLPAPVGGKHANPPILCEDQRIPQQRLSNLGRKKVDLWSDEYVVGSSPFATRDVYSRAAHLGIKESSKPNRRKTRK